MAPDKIILNDTAQYFDRFGSDCSRCIHFKGEEKWSCKAFPSGIPLSVLGGESHRIPWESQTNRITFKSKEYEKIHRP